MSIKNFLSSIFKKEKGTENKSQIEKPFSVIIYKNGKEISKFNSGKQNIKTLNELLKMFNLYPEYKIDYNIFTKSVEIFFNVKKNDITTKESKESK